MVIPDDSHAARRTSCPFRHLCPNERVLSLYEKWVTPFPWFLARQPIKPVSQEYADHSMPRGQTCCRLAYIVEQCCFEEIVFLAVFGQELLEHIYTVPLVVWGHVPEKRHLLR